MNMTLLGETITRKSSDTTKYRGFWMPRGGDEGTFAVDVAFVTNSGFRDFVETQLFGEPHLFPPRAIGTLLGMARASKRRAAIEKWLRLRETHGLTLRAVCVKVVAAAKLTRRRWSREVDQG